MSVEFIVYDIHPYVSNNLKVHIYMLYYVLYEFY